MKKTSIQLSTSDILRIEIELTTVCNLKCPLCIRETFPQPQKKFRKLDEIISQLDQYTELKYLTIAGAISEPTTYPHLFELIQYLKLRDIEISLYINGDTHSDMYYKKLGVIFREAKGNIYFTICGSTQEIHEKYRVGSSLEKVIRRLGIIKDYTGGKEVLTWIVFNYNQIDFNENRHKYEKKYHTEFFHTLPVAENFELDIDIHLPDEMSKGYKDNIDRSDYEGACPAYEYRFIEIDTSGDVYPCSLYKLFGEEKCFECSTKNAEYLRKNKIFKVAEPENDISIAPIRL